jgi:hypothetical protein
VHAIFATQDFDVANTGYSLSGDYVLRNVYDNKDVNAWGMVGVMIAFILFLRFVHYCLFLYASLPFLAGHNTTKVSSIESSSNGKSNETKAQYELVPQPSLQV